MSNLLSAVFPRYGNERPAELYIGAQKIAGWSWHEESGVAVSFEGTYHDTATVEAKGTCGFIPDWDETRGRSVQTSTRGINLLDPDTLEIGGLSGMSGADWQTDTRFRSGYIPVSAGEQYCFNANSAVFSLVGIHLYAQDKTWIIQTSSPTTALPTNAAFARLSWKRAGNASPALTTDDVEAFKLSLPQLECAATATEYEPYTGGAASPSPEYPREIVSNILAKRYRFPCADERGGWWEFAPDEPLRGIGAYQDMLTVSVSLGKARRAARIQKLTLDGSEEWMLIGIYGDCAAVCLSRIKPDTVNTLEMKAETLCSHFSRVSSYQGDLPEGFCFYWNTDTRLALRLSLTRLNCAAESEREAILAAAKAFLRGQAQQGTPVTVLYPLAETTNSAFQTIWTETSDAAPLAVTSVGTVIPDMPFRPIRFETKITAEGRNLYGSDYPLTGGYYRELAMISGRIHFSGILNPDYPTGFRSGYYNICVDHALEEGVYTFFWFTRYTDMSFAYENGTRNAYYFLDGKRYAARGARITRVALDNGDVLCRTETQIENCDRYFIEEVMFGNTGETFQVQCLRGAYETPPEWRPYKANETIRLPVLYGVSDENGHVIRGDRLTLSSEGLCETVREVGMKTLTGEENEWINWVPHNGDTSYAFELPVSGTVDNTPVSCSHFDYVSEIWSKDGIGVAALPDGAVCLKVPRILLAFTPQAGYEEQTGADATGLAVSAWRGWLREQNEAGSPLTLCYALETTETETMALGTLVAFPSYTRYTAAGEAIPELTIRARCAD